VRSLVLVLVLLAAGTASAQNALTISEVKLDRATPHTIGLQVLITGDANRNASITVRSTIAGAGAFRIAPPLFRVRPESVVGRTVPEQFAGTVFDLMPANDYEIELTVTDPDGGSEARIVNATTRAWPSDPSSPRMVNVTDAITFHTALQDAQAGDIIMLANGTYAGEFALNTTGTASKPIVIRGQTRDGVIIDGQNCAACNIVEVYGSYVHIEQLTIQNGLRAIRFLGTTTANAVLGARILDVVHGIASAPDQLDFTLCDNVVHGRLQWPLIYSDDAGAHADDQGIRVDGSGHVVCHNDIAGFGDPMINFAAGGRAYDFYGNDIHEIYGDGTELDRAEGNVRLWGNRFTNVYTAISMQPIYGGPAYVVRNVVSNVADEQIKLKSFGGTEEPSGALIYHNTFVSPERALNLQTPITQHHFTVANNLFVGPDAPTGRNVEWTAALDDGTFDGNGYYPDAGYWFGTIGTARTFTTLAMAKSAGIETNGRVVNAGLFASGLTAPASYTTITALADFALADNSNAIDAGLPLMGINSRHTGSDPELGARERDCAAPLYGPRPSGVLATNLVDCGADDPGIGADAGMPDPDPDPTKDGGCCQAPRDVRGTALLVLAVILTLRRKAAKAKRRQQHAHTR